MIVTLVLLALIGVLGWCGVTGWGVHDSRDPDFSLFRPSAATPDRDPDDVTGPCRIEA